MGARREDVDLELVLTDPVCARKWIADFAWDVYPAPGYIVLGLDEKIWLHSMTDEQAVQAALILLREVEIPRVWRQAKLFEDFGLH